MSETVKIVIQHSFSIFFRTVILHQALPDLAGFNMLYPVFNTFHSPYDYGSYHAY
jgi:hypothetical protein